MYAKTAQEALEQWDSGGSTWSVEMGGMGPGYEQCIQIMVFEMLRHLLDTKPDHEKWSDKDVCEKERKAIDTAVSDTIDKLSSSGAQFGAAVSLSTGLYMRGPASVLDEVGADRRIQVSKSFPTMP